MRSRAFRPIAATLSVLLLAGTPVHAGPVVIDEVIQVLGSCQIPPAIRLRSVWPGSGVISSEVKGSVQTGLVNRKITSRSGAVADWFVGAPAKIPDSLLSGVAIGDGQKQIGVEVVNQGDVEGTICDCGDITVPVGGFPKWPLVFLAAIPFLFIHGSETPSSTPPPTPTPTSPPTPQVPEPGALLLFGTALAAFGTGLRRRYARRASSQTPTEKG